MYDDYELETLAGQAIIIALDDGMSHDRIVPPSRCEPNPFPVVVDRGDGSTGGHGFPVTIWIWNVLTPLEVDILRSVCTINGVLVKSRAVRMRTRKPDNHTQFGYYTAWMHWPADIHSKRTNSGMYRNVAVEFTYLESDE